MGKEETRWDKMVIGMIKATNNNEIIWEPGEFSLSQKEEEINYSTYYETIIQEKKLRIYEKKYKDYRGPSVYAQQMQILGTGLKEFIPDPNEKIWYNKIVLEIANSDGVKLFEITGVEPLKELLETIKEKVSGVDELRQYFEKY